MDLSRYRPADDTSAMMHTARTLAAQDFAAMDSRIAAAKQERDGLLLDGEPKVLKQAENQLREARDEQERLEAIVQQLASRHAAALRRETLGTVDDARARVSAANQAIIDFWAADGDKLTAMLTASRELHGELQAAEYSLQLSRMRAFGQYPDDGDIIAAGGDGCSLPEDLDDWRMMMNRAGEWLIGQPEYVPPPAPASPPPPAPTPHYDADDFQRPEQQPQPHASGVIANGLDFFRNRAAARR